MVRVLVWTGWKYYAKQYIGCRTTKLWSQKRRHLSSGILHQLHLTKGNQSRKKEITVARKNHLFSSILHRSNCNRLLWPRPNICIYNLHICWCIFMNHALFWTKTNVSIDILFKRWFELHIVHLYITFINAFSRFFLSLTSKFHMFPISSIKALILKAILNKGGAAVSWSFRPSA